MQGRMIIGIPGSRSKRPDGCGAGYTPRMSTRAALFWVVLAAALSIAAAMLTRRTNTDGESAPALAALLATDPAAVEALTVERPGGGRVELRAADGVDTWTVSKDDGPLWPVEPGRVGALLRVMSDTTGTIVTDHGSIEGGTTLTLHGGDVDSEGSRDPLAVLRFDPNRMAGQCAVEVKEAGATRVLRVPDALQRAFEGAGPMAWRDRRALPGLSSNLSRVTIRTPDVRIELARVGGRWGVRSPVQALADAEVVEALCRSLQGIETERFLDGGVTSFPTETRISIVAEADRREPRGDGRTIERWSLDLGGVAPGGGAFLAKLGGELDETRVGTRTGRYGPVVAELSATRLSTVPATAEAYVSRTMLAVPGADVGLVRIGVPGGATRVYRRTASGDGWSVETADGGASPATTEDRQRLDQLVALLAEGRAERVTILPSEDALPGGLDVTLGGLSGQQIEVASIFVDRTEGRTSVVARTGRVTRAWTVAPELSAWIASLAPGGG